MSPSSLRSCLNGECRQCYMYQIRWYRHVDLLNLILWYFYRSESTSIAFWSLRQPEMSSSTTVCRATTTVSSWRLQTAQSRASRPTRSTVGRPYWRLPSTYCFVPPPHSTAIEVIAFTCRCDGVFVYVFPCDIRNYFLKQWIALLRDVTVKLRCSETFISLTWILISMNKLLTCYSNSSGRPHRCRTDRTCHVTPMRISI